MTWLFQDGPEQSNSRCWNEEYEWSRASSPLSWKTGVIADQMVVSDGKLL